MGSRTGVRVRGNRIEMYFDYLGKTRFERIDLPPLARNLNAVALRRERIVMKIKDGTFNYLKEFPNSKTAKQLYRNMGGETLNQALDKWLDESRNELKYSTLVDYQKSVEFWKDKLGGKLIPEITLREVRDIIYSKEISQKRASNLLIPLRHVFRIACEDMVIDNDPLRNWRPRIAKKEHVQEIDPFTKNEQLQLMGDDEINAFIQFSIWTGLRTGEALALEWADIGDEINVTKSLTKGVISVPKTKAGIRKVAMRPRANQALQLMQHTRFKKGRIFTFENDNIVRKRFVKLCQRTEVRYRKPYNTRHTFASMMLSAGENAMWVAQQMGHADVTMISRTYGHYIPSDRDEGSLADSMFGE